MLYALLSAAVAFILGWIYASFDNRKEKAELEQQREKLKEKARKQKQHIKKILTDVSRTREQSNHLIEIREAEFKRLLEESKQFKAALFEGFFKGREWLANAYADFIRTKDSQLENSLIVRDDLNSATADVISQLKAQRFELVRANKLLEYKIASYEEYFPFLADYRDAVLNEEFDLNQIGMESIGNVDPALAIGYLSEKEYFNMPSAKRFQVALNRYQKKSMSSFEKERAYERFVRYLFEKEGWTVTCQGHIKDFEEFGRDLFCRKGKRALIIQNEYAHKNMHHRENRLMQLYRALIQNRLTHPDLQISGMLITASKLDEDSSVIIDELEFECKHITAKRYPLIKCHTNPSTKQKIYHLPFDPDYDKILMNSVLGDQYVSSAEKAEQAGYQRLEHWTGLLEDMAV